MTIPINQSQIARTTAQWTSLNPILALDSIGIEVMSNGYNRYKRGDGVTVWLSLPYIDKVYKQDILIDDIPTDGSGSPVASNGVYDALAGKQDKITNTANRLFYGSGTSGTLSQLALPVNPKMLLQQDATGAPYWGIPLYRCFAEVLLGAIQVIATTTRTKLNFNAAGYVVDDYGLFTVNSTGLKVNQTGYYSLHYYIDLGAATGMGSGGLLWIGTNNNQQVFHRRLDGGNNADYADDILIYMTAGEYVYISIQQGAATSNSYAGNRRDAARVVLRPISL